MRGPLSGPAFSETVRREANALAWIHGFKGHVLAVDRLRRAERAGRTEDTRLWRAVEEALRPL